MNINKIFLANFRNFSDAQFSFEEGLNIVIGPNASGKTNLLESIFLIATGKSWKAGIEEEMIKEGQNLARVRAVVGESEKKDLEVILTKGKVGEVVGKKRLLVDRINKRLIDFAGNLRVVVFGPWDMGLIDGPPVNRRRFMDFALLAVDREYRRALLSYEKGIRQRNKILEKIRDGEANRNQLLFWDRLVIKNGDYISSRRQDLVDFVNNVAVFGQRVFEIEYDRSAISEARLAQYKDEEVAAATTLVGPHRDDLVFKFLDNNLKINKNLAVYGSRGEQRMAILWLKLAELDFIEESTGARPVLLLDDIFSELDHGHRKLVMSVVDKQQTILTTADPHMVEDNKNKRLIELK